MPTCSFCKKNYELPRGLTIFLFSGKSLHFCSSKCRRNHGLKRDSRKVNWVKKEKKQSKKQLKAEKVEQIKEETGGEEVVEEKPKEKSEKRVKS